jgi:polyketide synthase PksN
VYRGVAGAGPAPAVPDGALERADLDALARAWVGGARIDWEALPRPAAARRIALPGLAFAKQRHWLDDAPAASPAAQRAPAPPPLHPLIGHNASTLHAPALRSWLSDRAYYAEEHRVHGRKLFPGSGFVEMACVAGSLLGGAKVRTLKDVVWAQPLSLEPGGRAVRIALMPQGADEADWVVTSLDDNDEVVVHAEGRLGFDAGGHEPALHEERVDIEALKRGCDRQLAPAAYYALSERHGFGYGPAFRTIAELHVGASHALSRLQLAEHLHADFGQYILHPCLLDGALQTVSALVGRLDQPAPYIPFSIGEVQVLRAIPATCHVQVQRAGGGLREAAGVLKFDLRILTDSGHEVVKIRDFCVRALAAAAAGASPLPSPAGG